MRFIAWLLLQVYTCLWLGSAALSAVALLGSAPLAYGLVLEGLPNGFSLALYTVCGSASTLAAAAVATFAAVHRGEGRGVGLLYAFARLATIILFVVINMRVSSADLQGAAW